MVSIAPRISSMSPSCRCSERASPCTMSTRSSSATPSSHAVIWPPKSSSSRVQETELFGQSSGDRVIREDALAKEPPDLASSITSSTAASKGTPLSMPHHRLVRCSSLPACPECPLLCQIAAHQRVRIHHLVVTRTTTWKKGRPRNIKFSINRAWVRGFAGFRVGRTDNVGRTTRALLHHSSFLHIGVLSRRHPSSNPNHLWPGRVVTLIVHQYRSVTGHHIVRVNTVDGE